MSDVFAIKITYLQILRQIAYFYNFVLDIKQAESGLTDYNVYVGHYWPVAALGSWLSQ